MKYNAGELVEYLIRSCLIKAEVDKRLVKCVSDVLVNSIFFICFFNPFFLAFHLDCTAV